MLSFWKKNISSISESIESYSVNGIPCKRSHCAAVIRELAGKEGQLIIKKTTSTHEKKSHRDPNLYYSFTVDCSLIQRIIQAGEAQYQNLIISLFTALDTGIKTSKDFSSNFEQLKKDLYSFYRVVYCYTVDRTALRSEEIIEMLCECQVLMLINASFNASALFMTDSGRSYLQKFGKAACAQIEFPEYKKTPAEALWDITDAKIIIKTILNNFESLENGFKTNTALMPAIRDYAIKNLYSIRDLALEYNAIFDADTSPSVGSSSMI